MRSANALCRAVACPDALFAITRDDEFFNLDCDVGRNRRSALRRMSLRK